MRHAFDDQDTWTSANEDDFEDALAVVQSYMMKQWPELRK